MKRALPQRPAMALREIRASSGLLLVLLLGSASTAVAVDFSGSALVAATATDNRGIESDLLEQQYQFRLFQQLTPYLR
ncbi:MAG: hypothetical protein WBG93_08810, partial [Thermoanaerobaculia bacterium]